MIDEELIEAKIDIILTNLEYLDQVKNGSKKEFLHSFERIQATKHSLQESIEACIDISNHLISENVWVRAETYSDMFFRLYEQKVIDENLKDSLSDMARFRNLLVHRYGKIDDERIWTILQEDLKDFELFISKIERFISSL